MGRKIIKPLRKWGKFKCQRENPSNSQLPILSFVPNHLFVPEVVELVNSWGWEEYGSQIRIREAINFWKTCFWLMGQINAQKCYPSHGSLTSFIFLMQLKLVGLSPSSFCLPHTVEATCASLLYFSHAIPKIIAELKFITQGFISPFTNSFSSCKLIFPSYPTCVVVVVCILVFVVL